MAIILVVDDEVGIRELLSEILIHEGYDVRLAENATAARQVRNELRPDLVLLDIWMPDTDGISLLKEWHAAGHLNMPVVMMSGHGTIDTAVEATRFGAFDFLEKPIALQKLLSTVQKALKHDKPPVRPALTLESFTRSRFRQGIQAAPRTGGIEIAGPAHQGGQWRHGRNLRAHPATAAGAVAGPVGGKQRANPGHAGKNQRRRLVVPDLAVLGKMQQMNLAFAIERLEKLNLQLVAATVAPSPTLVEAGWDSKLLARLGEVWVAMPIVDRPRRRAAGDRRLVADQLRRARRSTVAPFFDGSLEYLAHAAVEASAGIELERSVCLGAQSGADLAG